MTRWLPRSHWIRAALVAILLSVVHTWPLATAPATLSRNDNPDVLLNEWIVAWVQHQLPRDPSRLFQGNIFHPARDTLALSEPLIVPALAGLPLRALGGSPTLVHNVLLLAGLSLTMLAMYGLVHEWTRDEAAALIAGSAFAYNAHTLERLVHLQAMHAYGLPAAILAVDRLVRKGRLRDAAMLAASVTALAYTSGYLTIFALVAIAVTVLVRAAEWIRAPRELLSRLAFTATLSAVAVIPIYLPYRRVAVEQGIARPLEEITQYSATLWSYVAPSGRLHEMWSGRFMPNPVDSFFPGFVVLALAVAGLMYAGRRRTEIEAAARGRTLMLIAIASAGLLLSLGNNTPVYGWFYRAFPFAGSIRGASRFGSLFLLSTAALAGIGAWHLRQQGSGGRLAAAIGAAAILVINVEALRAPFDYVPFAGIPRVYTLLEAERGPVVLVEQPLHRPEAIVGNAEYVMNSTAHWRPLVNGYSGYVPREYLDSVAKFSSFPARESIEAMRSAGVTHVMVHPHRFDRGSEVIDACDRDPRLRRLASGRNEMTLYRIEATQEHEKTQKGPAAPAATVSKEKRK